METKIILDTNVPTMAAIAPNKCSSDKLEIQKKCIDYIYNLTKGKTKLVLDMGYEIFNEYINNVEKNTNIGDIFLKWLYSYIAKIDMSNFLMLEKDDNKEFVSFPINEDTKNFDPSDRKFVALANIHPEKPPIIEGTDAKWWGYKEAFLKYGIKIHFLDEEYAQRMYQKKILDRKPIL